MRPLLSGLIVFSASGLIFAACGQEPTSAATGTSASGTGGVPNCEGVYLVYGDKDGGHPCDICLHAECCSELSNCRDEACIECANFPGLGCGEDAKAARRCADEHCSPTCAPATTPTSGGTGGTSGGTSTSSTSGG
jgi:hypothetical protein